MRPTPLNTTASDFASQILASFQMKEELQKDNSATFAADFMFLNSYKHRISSDYNFLIDRSILDGYLKIVSACG